MMCGALLFGAGFAAGWLFFKRPEMVEQWWNAAKQWLLERK